MSTHFPASPIAWFEIVVKDMERAIKFYKTVFQVQLTIENMPDMQMALFPYQESYPGGALVKGDAFSQCREGSGTTVIYLTVESVGAALSRIEKTGGSIVMPSTSIGENGFIGMFVDSEGNTIGLWAEVA